MLRKLFFLLRLGEEQGRSAYEKDVCPVNVGSLQGWQIASL